MPNFRLYKERLRILKREFIMKKVSEFNFTRISLLLTIKNKKYRKKT